MVYFSPQAIATLAVASSFLLGKDFLPMVNAASSSSTLYQQEDHNDEHSTIPNYGSIVSLETNDDIRGLTAVADLNFTHHDTDIGAARFHEIVSLEGDSTSSDFSLGRRTDCNNDGTTIVTAGILLETNDQGEDMFKYVVKIFGDGSGDTVDQSIVHTIIEDGDGSIFDSDAYVEIALSGDGNTLVIANTKPDRGINNPAVSTVKVFKFDSVSKVWPSIPITIYSGNAGGGGYYFGGLQVSLNDDGSKLALGLPYVDAVINSETISSVGNVQIYDLETASPSDPTFDLAESGLYSGAVIKEGAYIGRKVAIAGDGTSFVFSAPGDNKVYWSEDGTTLVPFSGGQEDSDVGSSLAISYDGKIFAFGAKNHDDLTNDAPDKGIVTVQKKSDANGWERLGEVLMGERGEGAHQGSYYVGDQFGYDLALSELNAYDSNGSTNIIRLLVGSPKSDVTGLVDEDYYQGHGELYQINHVTATPETSWNQVAYDVDGQTSGEKSGTSVAMSSNGDTIIIGAPGYQAASGKGGFFEGIVRVYKQTEYSSAPSSVPSSAPSITNAPSQQPSNIPSVSLAPSVLPTTELDKEFQILSTFGPFGEDTEKDWCLTAFGTNKLHVRPCLVYKERSENDQLWKFTESGGLTLAGKEIGEFCIKSIYRQLKVASPCASDDDAMSNFSFQNGSIIQEKNSKVWKLGFDPESRFENVRLYRDGALNDVLDKWDIRYSHEFEVPEIILRRYNWDGGWRVEKHPRVLADVNGDGKPDIVGFANEGVKVTPSAPYWGFETTQLMVEDFFCYDQGWRVENHPRFVEDVNGDGRADIVGFYNDGVYVSLSTGTGFTAPEKMHKGFGTNTGWRVDWHPRFVTDMNGDGKADIVGFSQRGVDVAYSNGNGFDAAIKIINNFFTKGYGWDVEKHPRFLEDVNGDGKKDIIGFGNDGVYVSLSTGTGFTEPQIWYNGFGSNGWNVGDHPRFVTDVDGDGKADIVGFHWNEVYVAYSNGSGFDSAIIASRSFVYNDGWRVAKHPRFLEDVDGDGKKDIIGFGQYGTYVSFSNDNGWDSIKKVLTAFGYNTAWRVDRHPRFVTDMNGDGKADIVGFANRATAIRSFGY